MHGGTVRFFSSLSGEKPLPLDTDAALGARMMSAMAHFPKTPGFSAALPSDEAAAKHAATLIADVPNFTNSMPQIQIDEIIE